MAHLMQQLAESEGYCCVRRMILDTAEYSNKELAAHYGVTERTIANWRRKLDTGNLPCKELPTCYRSTSSDP